MSSYAPRRVTTRSFHLASHALPSRASAREQARAESRAKNAAARDKKYKHRGFLAVRKRNLTFGSMVFAVGMMAVPALPASAAPVEVASSTTAVQSLRVAASAAEGTVERDRFGVIDYSAVQAPVPMDTPISSGFGYRVAPCAGCSTNHRGIDLTPGVGYEVEAIAEGTVSKIGNPSGSLGVYVVVDHVIDGRTISSVYAHMQLGSMTLNVGDTVARGQVVGKVGNTGMSTGPHLYFAILLDGVTPVDPHEWLVNNINS